MATDKQDDVNTDLHADDSPFNQDGYVGVDPYFQGAPLKKAPEEKADTTSTTTEKKADDTTSTTTEKSTTTVATPTTPPASK